MRKISNTYFFALVLCCLALMGSYYFEYVQGLQPCLLCILQRLLLGLLALVFLVAAIHNPGRVGKYFYNVLAFFISLAGAAAAGRQVWLQHQPPGHEALCLPGLSYLLQTQSLPVVIKMMIHGGKSCAEVTAKFLGLSLPVWVLIFFLVIAIFNLMQIRR